MISIIIPTLNEEKVLERTLSCISKLRAHEYEIIISDGKSKDATLEIAKKYNCRIVEYTDSRRQTIGQARNMGAAVATGEFLVFLDADVEILDIDNFFTRAIGAFTVDQSLAGFAPYIKYIPEEATRADRFFGGMMNMLYFCANKYLHIGAAPGEFQMMRTSTFKKIGGYNEKLAASEDIDLFSRLRAVGMTRIDQHLAVYQATRRVHAVGWPKLLWSWFRNTVSSKFFKKSFDSEWTPIR